MRLSMILLAFSSVYIYLVNAEALLAVFQSEVDLGKTYPVQWLLNSEEYLRLVLVRQIEAGWKPIETLFENRTGNVPGGTYQWTVSNNLTVGSGYGLWLRSTPIANDTLGYADLTDWFNITFANSSMPDSTSTSSIAATMSATASSTSAADVVAQDNGLSRHAAIGIAVGCSVGVSLFVIVVAITIIRRRKAHSADSKYSSSTHRDDLARPSMTTTGTVVELPEDPRSGRTEILGATKQPLEKDADDVAEEKRTILPDKPIEIG